MKVMNHNQVNQLMQRYWANSSASSARAIRNLASGYRINAAADGAAGLSISRRMHAQTAGVRSAGHSTQDAVSMLQTADGALGSVQAVVERMAELAERAENGVLSYPGRGMLQNEYRKLACEIDRIGEEASFNGSRLFDGARYTIQVGAGPEDTMDVTMSAISARDLGLEEADLSDAQGAQKAAGALGEAMQQLSDRRSEIGVSANGLQSLMSSLADGEINLSESLSKIADSDIAAGSLNRNISAALGLASLSMMKNAPYLMPYNTLQLLAR